MTTRNTIHDPNTIVALEALPPTGSTDGQTCDRPAVKLFYALSNAIWIVWEYDPDTGEAFGYADLFGDTGELGYIDINELVTVETLIPIERDIHVHTLVEAYESRDIDIPDYLVAPTR